MRIAKFALIGIATVAGLWIVLVAALKWRLDSTVETNLALLPHVEATATSSNETAQRIAAASAALGLPLKVREEGAQFVTPAQDGELRGEIARWIRDQSESAVPSTPAVPETIESFLSTRSNELRALDSAVDAGDPVWQFEPGPDGPIPNLLAHLSIVRLYAVRALDAERAGRGNEAWEHLRRAFELTEALASRPQLICSLIALEEYGLIARTSLHLSSDPPPWFEDFTQPDPAQMFIRSVALETSVAGENLFDAESVLQSENPTLIKLAGEILLLPRTLHEIRNETVKDRPFIESLATHGGCSFGPDEESTPHSIGVRIETARRQIDLARLVRAAREGESVTPQRVCGYAWSVRRDAGFWHFSLPESAPRRNLGVDLREFRLPVANGTGSGELTRSFPP